MTARQLACRLCTRAARGNSMLFLERMIEQMPFPVQAIQTDRGREFFAYLFPGKGLLSIHGHVIILAPDQSVDRLADVHPMSSAPSGAYLKT